jgi:hypothetical protein
MRSLFLFLVLVGGRALLLAEEPKVQSYPDLSSPAAAAFSLGVALSQGDEAAARNIYVGQDKEFSTLLDGFVKFKLSSDKLTNQGQLPLKRYTRKNFCQELVAPAASAAFHGDAVLAGMLF